MRRRRRMTGKWWRWRRRRWRKRRSRIGETEEGAVCRAGLLWITWSSAGLRIYSSTAAEQGSGVSCMLLPRIAAKRGCGGSICWILDSAALEPDKLQRVSKRAAYAALALRVCVCTSPWRSHLFFFFLPVGRCLSCGAEMSVGILSDPFSPTRCHANSQIKKKKKRFQLNKASADFAPSLQ